MFKALFRKIILGVFLIGIVASLVTAGVATSPWCSTLEIWEPILWDSESGFDEPGDAIIARVVTTSQGYTAWRRQDTTKDTSVGNCTRNIWDALPTTGIMHVCTHGNSSCMVAAYSTDKSTLIDTVNGGGWADSDNDKTVDDDMEVPVDQYNGCYRVRVLKDWYADNWKGDADNNKAIVTLVSCSIASGSPSVLDQCGGRVGFGYSNSVIPATQGKADMELLFNYMSGVAPAAAKGTKRKAGDAFAAGTWSSGTGFTMRGENDTTLCPSVESTVINPDEGASFSEGAGGGSSGTGSITFDTHCYDLNASEALQYTVTGDNVTLSNIQWSNNYTITFDYSTDECEPDYLVSLKAVAESISANSLLEGQSLDGGNSEENGVAANGDDYTWSFSE